MRREGQGGLGAEGMWDGEGLKASLTEAHLSGWGERAHRLWIGPVPQATCVSWSRVRGGPQWEPSLQGQRREGEACQGLRRAFLRGACLPSSSLPGPASSPPRALGPVWGTPGEVRLDSASRGRGCVGRGAGS